MISVDNVSKSFGDVKALESINLEVNENELFGLIGPDGAGKTTLIRIMVSLLLPDAGKVILNNHNVVNDYKLIRQEVGYMPGRFSLYQDLTIEENLNFFASVFGTTIQENYHLIQDIYKQIEPFKNRRAGKLSGGMKQKLALSCALIHKPRVLILDEPTTGVDAVSRKEFWDMLGRLKKAGITIFVSTPYMDEASRCDRVALIQDGQIMTVNSPEEIVSEFGQKIWKVKSENTFKLLNDLQCWENNHSVYPFGQFLHLTPKNDKIERDDIIDFMTKNGHVNCVAEAGVSGIEDVFMDLMKNKR